MNSLKSFVFIITCLTPLFSGNFNVNAQSLSTDIDVGIQQRADFFTRIFDPQYQTSIFVSNKQDFGNLTLRLNHGRKFNLAGNQWEAESYPIINDKTYGYLAYAWSNAEIFPRHRYGIELFRALPRSSEISLGMRYINFTTAAETYIITASVSHYFRAWLFSARPFLILGESGRGQSLVLSARYFLNDYGNQITARAGIGVSPDSRTIFIDDGVFDEQQLLLQSLNIGAEMQYNLLEDLNGNLGVSWTRRELSFDTGSFVGNWSITGGLVYSFN